jgi:Mg2+ and Co2+ transporter CorA
MILPPPIRKLGPGYLAYALLDAVIDAYHPILERMGDFLETLEEEVVQRPTPESRRKVYRAKRELLTLRRSVYPILLGVMAGTAIAMLGFFYRLGWLGRSSRKEASEE